MKKIALFFIAVIFSFNIFSQAPAIQWQKCLGGTGSEGAISVQQTADGGYIVAGHTDSNDGDVTGNHGISDHWLLKLDSSGNMQWKKCLGGTGEDLAYSVEQTSEKVILLQVILSLMMEM